MPKGPRKFDFAFEKSGSPRLKTSAELGHFARFCNSSRSLRSREQWLDTLITLFNEIRPGEEDQFHFIVRVKNRGTYALIFSSIDEESKARPLPEDLGPCVPSTKDPMKPRWESSASFVEGEIDITSVPWRWTVVDHHHWLRLFAGEKQGNEPAEKRNAKEKVEDDNGRFMGTVFSDGCYGGQEVYV